MFEVIAFYVFAALTLCAFLIVVMSNNILYALSALAFGMILVSGFFFLLHADFLGIVQITVYTGAVVVMYAFGMMFFDLNKEVKERFHNQFIVWLIVAVFALSLFVSFGKVFVPEEVKVADMSLSALSHLLFKDYILGFGAVTVMLLMSMIAGVAVGAHKPEFPKDSDNEKLRK